MFSTFLVDPYILTVDRLDSVLHNPGAELYGEKETKNQLLINMNMNFMI